jgi:hypothetical protein
MGWSDEPSKSYKEWRYEWDGSMLCDCGHGCNQWLKKNHSKVSLIMRVRDNNGKTSLDKIVQMKNDRADKIWYFLVMRDSRKFNEELRKSEELIANKIKETWRPG